MGVRSMDRRGMVGGKGDTWGRGRGERGKGGRDKEIMNSVYMVLITTTQHYTTQHYRYIGA